MKKPRTRFRPAVQPGFRGYLTSIDPDFDRRIRETPAGMFFWSGMAADPKATCGTCKHDGCSTEIVDGAGNVLGGKKHPQSCALVQQYTGKAGKPIDKATPGCKYHDAGITK